MSPAKLQRGRKRPRDVGRAAGYAYLKRYWNWIPKVRGAVRL